ncbi:DnaJ-related protein rsp1 [Podospora australis]|uniref:DnaJ-related protein rsp1 n=1 Tax=Podospora australis TaxID=1536484 RepID=A0AAN6WR57_9PEZI|nr:DnaJ-related protein rsp1 [Podospora australis]
MGVKVDMSRDYYADLEVTQGADIAEIKKQFKKLALKYHPDRNPGKEDEAKDKFILIQAAHEVLTNAEAKSSYDAKRRNASRYGGASGVTGNPWMNTARDVNNKYGAPPQRRPPMPPRPAQTTTTGASSRYQGWGQGKQTPKSKTETFRAQSEAWERARASSTQNTAQNTPRPAKPARDVPPSPTPRTAAQARRAEAAFGATRRTGFQPSSPMPGDEPPVRSHNYNNTYTTSGGGASGSAYTTANAGSTPAPKARPQSEYIDPLTAQFRDAHLDNRQRTPYASHTGEKTNPFEPLNNVNRAKSMRDGGKPVPAPQPMPPPRQRSASVGSDSVKRSTTDPYPSQTTQRPQPQSKASARYSPRFNQTPPQQPDSAPATSAGFATAAGFGAAAAAGAAAGAAFAAGNSSASSVSSSANATVDGGASAQAKTGPKVYGAPLYSSSPFSMFSSQKPRAAQSTSSAPAVPKTRSFFPWGQDPVATPSGEQDNASPGLNSFKRGLQSQLDVLLSAKERSHKRPFLPEDRNRDANATDPASFAVPDDDPSSPAQQARFARHSADNINTQFVSEDKAKFEFSAGAESPTRDDPFMRARQRHRGRQSPLRNEFTSSQDRFTPAAAQQPPPVPPKVSAFDPKEWEETIKSNIFEPKPPTRTSVSPTRPIRPIKKPRPVRMTAGSAGMVDEEDSTSGEDKPKAAEAPGSNGGRSPNAMDVDPPQPETPIHPHEPRNIPVEPTKPEWRAGNVGPNVPGGAPLNPKPASGFKMPAVNPNTVGSEDTEEFMKPNLFSEFKNVAPFADKPAGLGSFADLSSNLPFQSQPSLKIPIPQAKPQPLTCPPVPQPPKPPVALMIPSGKVGSSAWNQYAKEFEAYLKAFSDWNKQLTDHFQGRQQHLESQGFSWVNATGDSGYANYLNALEQDKPLRQKWMTAMNAHELAFKEFQQLRWGLLRER